MLKELTKLKIRSFVTELRKRTEKGEKKIVKELIEKYGLKSFKSLIEEMVLVQLIIIKNGNIHFINECNDFYFNNLFNRVHETQKKRLCIHLSDTFIYDSF
jgi:predicted DNA-binding protein